MGSGNRWRSVQSIAAIPRVQYINFHRALHVGRRASQALASLPQCPPSGAAATTGAVMRAMRGEHAEHPAAPSILIGDLNGDPGSFDEDSTLV